ncbi:unnamed protein product [Larinioides sclopetarius]|uniref:Uncharacterized protein n=1 Tax=Larinioides sclopetarius TaxID=280406 RepID=A0AAV2BWI4_9ARAC
MNYRSTRRLEISFYYISVQCICKGKQV